MSGASLARAAHNFISVTSSSASSSACTRSCLGVRVIRYGCGVREDWPRYPSSEMGSSGGDRMSYAQSNREIASHSSRSATWIAGQMRRLRHAHSNKTKNEGKKTASAKEDRFWLAGKKQAKKDAFVLRTLHRTPNGLGPLDRRACSIQHTSVCLPGSAQV